MAASKPKKEPAVAAEPEAIPQTNVDRLLRHLKKDSLAARLVNAHRSAPNGESLKAMKPILTARLREVRDGFDKT